MAAMGTMGTLAPFDSKIQEWEEYSKIIELFFIANSIEDEDKKQSILLSVVVAPPESHQTWEKDLCTAGSFVKITTLNTSQVKLFKDSNLIHILENPLNLLPSILQS